MKKIILIFLFLLSSTLFAQSSVLGIVKKNDILKCGNGATFTKLGFMTKNNNGEREGLEADMCRSIAAAVLGDSSKVQYIPEISKNRYIGLSSGQFDVLIASTTFTMTRDARNGVDPTVPYYYDGQTFIVNKKLTKNKVKKIKDLNGATICAVIGTSSEVNLQTYFQKSGLKYKILLMEGNEAVIAALEAGRCQAFINDQSSLLSMSFNFKNPKDYLVLNEVISKEPLGPYVKQGDDQWRQIVSWVMMGLFQAEELGINQANVDKHLGSKDPYIQKFLGKKDDIGVDLGLDKKWVYNVIKQVGNYRDIFERNLGEGSDFKLERGLNKSWKDGGLQYAWPM